MEGVAVEQDEVVLEYSNLDLTLQTIVIGLESDNLPA